MNPNTLLKWWVLLLLFLSSVSRRAPWQRRTPLWTGTCLPSWSRWDAQLWPKDEEWKRSPPPLCDLTTEPRLLPFLLLFIALLWLDLLLRRLRQSEHIYSPQKQKKKGEKCMHLKTFKRLGLLFYCRISAVGLHLLNRQSPPRSEQRGTLLLQY